MREGVVKFVEKLPEPKRRRGDNLARLEALRSRPGEWAEVAFSTHPTGGSQILAYLRLVGQARGVEVETTSRMEERDGKTVRVLYARVPKVEA